MVAGCRRSRTTTIRNGAGLACRLPPRLSRWRVVLPEEAGIGRGPAELGVGGLRTNPTGVVACGTEQFGGTVEPDPEGGDQRGRGLAGEALELAGWTLISSCSASQRRASARSAWRAATSGR
jgi:hypothetical protein